MVSAEEVIWAYRLFLGRNPESAEVIAHFANFDNTENLRNAFLACAEFRAKALVPYLPIDVPPMAVEWRTDQETSRALLARVQATWNRLGRERPHWSVLSSEQFLPERVHATAEAFFASGASDVRLLLATLGRLGYGANQFPEIFEFGCGLGRVTSHLARQFTHVTACDVSPSHLEQARSLIASAGLRNVTLLRAEAPGLGMSEPFDLWFSRIVLQHNSPPLMAMILRRALRLLRPAGVAIFQIPTYGLDYQFSLEQYLKAAPPSDGFEMHVLPQQAVFELADEAGCRVLEIREDNSVGTSNWISNWITLGKRPTTPPLQTARDPHPIEQLGH